MVCVAFAIGVADSSLGQRLEPSVWPEPRPLDATRLATLGLRVVEGEHVTLVTDLPASDELERLPAVASLALPQLADYFGVPREKLDGWRAQACVIGDRDKFAAAGLLPPPPHDEFPHGLSYGYEFWVIEQPSSYYRRALFLHELTHSFMATRLGSCGPGWYMEATAELMGAHTLSGDDLQLRAMPASKRAAPHWGRVPLIRARTTEEGHPNPLGVSDVMRIDNHRVLDVESYAWVWALGKFLDAHPRYRDRWRRLSELVLQQDFDDRFRAAFRADGKRLNQEFRLFAGTLEYGHDIEREAIRFSSGVPIERRDFLAANVRADRGWQPSGVAVDKGGSYRYQASGRFVVAREADGTPWPCEAGGVTLRYHAGRPLGQLLAAVDRGDGFLRPLPLGTEGEFTAPASGTLYLRVNDSPAELAENEGGLTVKLSLATPE